MINDRKLVNNFFISLQESKFTIGAGKRIQTVVEYVNIN
jgi:hypothetical protein